ncbi:MAG: hypothetical protein IKV86_02770 [Clostridia bacterium]|nr:hypothetical protein [Clostridia bacterium]
MLKKSGKVLLAYIIGVVVSIFLAVPLSPFFSNNLRIFSVITTVITLGLVYAEMWKLGKYDTLRKENKPLNAMGYMGLYTVITFIVELIVIIAKPATDFTIWGIIPAVWFFPFNFFSDSKNFWVIYLIVSVATIVISIIGYYMGDVGFSIVDKILTARKNRIDKKAQAHKEEIERIKEQYRKKD